MKVYGVTGWKNSGKTGLMERLVGNMKGRGFSVSTIKHAHHSFDVDHPGKDSHRHRVAGAQEVLLASSLRFALMHEIGDGQEPSLAELMTKLAPVDIVLIEGYKTDLHPKIEVHRSQTGQPLIAPNDATIRAIASNADITLDRPVFDLDDTRSISEFILAEVGL
jgi:molybdopterin-guanine dinucleotide biosynthesis protein B